MYRCSNTVLGFLNLLTLIASIPIIFAGLWMARSATTCQNFLQTPLLWLGFIVLLVSLAGFIGACFHVAWALWFYLFVMFFLIAGLIGLTVFGFAVTGSGGSGSPGSEYGVPVPGHIYKEYHIGDYSAWMRRKIGDAKNWEGIKSCIIGSKTCAKVQTWTPEDYVRNDLSPVQSGCCKPPTSCSYGTATVAMTQDPDCYKWNNSPEILCYECDSCKAGVMESIRHTWQKLSVLLVVMVVFLIAIYSVGCCAFRNARRAETDYPYGHNRMTKVRPRWDYYWVHFLTPNVQWLSKRHKVALHEALEKIKSELMFMGFVSLLLTGLQKPISKICISPAVADTWHPCKKISNIYDDECSKKGKSPLMSIGAIHELHIFIFILAVFHVLYCITTLALGRLKMRRWMPWENETKSVEYQSMTDQERFKFTRETSFGRRHLNFWSRTTILLWIVCFFRQFYGSVTKVDYLTLRRGFIMAHLAPGSDRKFDFRKYISRSLEEDFTVIVGISPIMWFFAVLFLLGYTHGWYSYYWLPFLPLIIILLVGTKLQLIITNMGLKIQDVGDVIKGNPVVHPDDNLFWFSNPRFLLLLIHSVLFQNAFQLAFFAFSWSKYGSNSCFHHRLEDAVIRISMGIIIHILCSYVTLPLYALVAQMGSKMKPTVFSERVAKAIMEWHHSTRMHGHHTKSHTNNNNNNNNEHDTAGKKIIRPVSSSSSSKVSSPAHLLNISNNLHPSDSMYWNNHSVLQEDQSNEDHQHDIELELGDHDHDIQLEDSTRSAEIKQLGSTSSQEIQISLSDYPFQRLSR